MFEKAKGLKICNTILKKIGARGFLLTDEKMYLLLLNTFFHQLIKIPELHFFLV